MERFHQVQEKVEVPTERSFGFVFAGFFCFVALFPYLIGTTFYWWPLAVAGLFALLAVALPRALAPFNRWWLKLGLLLHRVASPLALGIIFFGAILPTNIVFRLLRKDPLRLRLNRTSGTYWIPREDRGRRPESMKDQF